MLSNKTILNLKGLTSSITLASYETLNKSLGPHTWRVLAGKTRQYPGVAEITSRAP